MHFLILLFLFEKDHEVHRHPLFLEIYLLYLVINRRKKSKYSLIQSFLFARHQQKSRDVQKYPDYKHHLLMYQIHQLVSHLLQYHSYNLVRPILIEIE